MAPARRRLNVRDTPVDLLAGGDGPPLLFLHSTGAAGRWAAFHERLAERFRVWFPSHPGHGGSPAADWIEHVSDLAFHYLDLLDALGLARVHLVGASLGGWIAAELATMGSHRLTSLVLIDPVGIKLDGWIYPFLFGMDVPDLVATLFHEPAAALALAPSDQELETIIALHRERTALARVAWNPYLYDPLLRRRLARITAPTLVCWGAHDRLAPARGATEWTDRIPRALYRCFQRSGHLPHLEEPEAVAAAVREFCEARECAP